MRNKQSNSVTVTIGAVGECVTFKIQSTMIKFTGKTHAITPDQELEVDLSQT